MNELEVRGVIWSFDEPIHHLTAIPWCTTHDSMAEDNYMCDVEVGYSADLDVKPDCVVSIGGPDHKWWKDA